MMFPILFRAGREALGNAGVLAGHIWLEDLFR